MVRNKSFFFLQSSWLRCGAISGKRLHLLGSARWCRCPAHPQCGEGRPSTFLGAPANGSHALWWHTLGMVRMERHGTGSRIRPIGSQLIRQGISVRRHRSKPGPQSAQHMAKGGRRGISLFLSPADICIQLAGPFAADPPRIHAVPQGELRCGTGAVVRSGTCLVTASPVFNGILMRRP